jgi:hypothetical protein
MNWAQAPHMYWVASVNISTGVPFDEHESVSQVSLISRSIMSFLPLLLGSCKLLGIQLL